MQHSTLRHLIRTIPFLPLIFLSVPANSDGFSEPAPIDFNDHRGYQALFDGKSLKGWDGDPKYWRVEQGVIVGESTPRRHVSNTYLVYRGVQPKDFTLKLEIKIEVGGGSGIQYRGTTGLPFNHPPIPGEAPFNLNWMMGGPQADFWSPEDPIAFSYTGQFYSENSTRGIEAWRGQVVVAAPDGSRRLMGQIADRAPLGGYIKVNDWNQYVIITRGGTFFHILNGQLMSVLIDDDPKSPNNRSGVIGIELEGYPSRVSVRNIWLKKIS